MFRMNLEFTLPIYIGVIQATNSWQEIRHENIFWCNKYEASFRWILNYRK